jgi:hypothetical protein
MTPGHKATKPFPFFSIIGELSHLFHIYPFCVMLQRGLDKNRAT